MPLSEHEERILAEIERQLAAEDPRFAARARRGRRGPSRRTRIRLAILLAVLGLGNLLFLTVSIAFGAVGLSLMLVAILLAVTAANEKDVPQAAPVPPDERT
jgi:hypothetical protein